MEEYSLNTGDIEYRKIKEKTTTGKEFWVTEIGEETQKTDENFIIKENSMKNVSI